MMTPLVSRVLWKSLYPLCCKAPMPHCKTLEEMRALRTPPCSAAPCTPWYGPVVTQSVHTTMTMHPSPPPGHAVRHVISSDPCTPLAHPGYHRVTTTTVTTVDECTMCTFYPQILFATEDAKEMCERLPSLDHAAARELFILQRRWRHIHLSPGHATKWSLVRR